MSEPRHGDLQVANIELLGTQDDGRNADIHISQIGQRVLVLDADVGAGNLRVKRAAVR